MEGRERTTLEAALLGVISRWQDELPLELHAKDICGSIEEQNEVPGFDTLSAKERRERTLAVMKLKLATLTGSKRRAYAKRIRGRQPVLHLNRAERSRLYQEILDAIAGVSGLRIFFDAAEKRQVLKKHGMHISASEVAFEHVVGRFVAYMNRVGFAEHRQTYGRLIMDDDPKDESLFRSLHQKYCRLGHDLGRVKGRIGTPSFVDSSKSLGIQAADICAYAIRRYIENWNKAGDHEKTQFLRIFGRVDRVEGRLHGARHLIRTDRCRCLICLARGYAPGADGITVESAPPVS
jgi:hypothetical protein